MSKEFFIRKLMRRDELDREEAEFEVEDAIITAITDAHHLGESPIAQMEAYEDALMSFLGLEPDYIMQFIDAIESWKEENPERYNQIIEED